MKKIFAHARRSTFPTLLALALLFAGLGPWPFGAPKAHATNTPTLIQHVASSANPVGVGISGNAFKIPLPNAVGAGNALILGITYPHGKTVTITDNNGNTWPGSATK